MKKIILISLVVLAAMGSTAQTTAPVAVKKTEAAKPNQVANPAAYACPKCYTISKGAGKCDHCQVDKVQLGTYYCYKCQKSTGTKPGPCPVCKGETVQITRKYCAQHSMNQVAPKPNTKS